MQSYRGVNFSESWWMNYEKLLSQAEWPHRLSEDQRITKLEVVRQGWYKTQPDQPVTCFLA